MPTQHFYPSLLQRPQVDVAIQQARDAGSGALNWDKRGTE